MKIEIQWRKTHDTESCFFFLQINKTDKPVDRVPENKGE